MSKHVKDTFDDLQAIQAAYDTQKLLVTHVQRLLLAERRPEHVAALSNALMINMTMLTQTLAILWQHRTVEEQLVNASTPPKVTWSVK